MAATRTAPKTLAALSALGLCLACSGAPEPAPDPAPQPAAPPTTDSPPTVAPTAFDCSAPPPPTPRCPPESSPSCAQLWDDAEGWRAACGHPDAEPAQPETEPAQP